MTGLTEAANVRPGDHIRRLGVWVPVVDFKPVREYDGDRPADVVLIVEIDGEERELRYWADTRVRCRREQPS